MQVLSGCSSCWSNREVWSKPNYNCELQKYVNTGYMGNTWRLTQLFLWESEKLLAEDGTSELRWTSKYEYYFSKLSQSARKWLIEKILHPKPRKTAQKEKYIFREECVIQEDRREMQELDCRVSFRICEENWTLCLDYVRYQCIVCNR